MSDEPDTDRLDRNLDELLAEIRVALPGVQVLFAFLLVVPFNARFGELTSFEEKVYLVALLSAALATACLIAPTAHHRLLFRRRERLHLVEVGSRMVLAGIGFLALAMTSAILVVSHLVFEPPAAIAITAGAGISFGLAWFGLPVARRAGGGAR